MDFDKKKSLIYCLLFIFIGLFGLIFYNTVPLALEFFRFKIAILASIIIIIIGLIFLLLRFANKFPNIPNASVLIPVFWMDGTIFFIIFILDPISFSPLLLLGIYFYGFGGFHLWLCLKEKERTKIS